MGFSSPKKKMVVDADIDHAYFAGGFNIFYSKQRSSAVYLHAFLILIDYG